MTLVVEALSETPVARRRMILPPGMGLPDVESTIRDVVEAELQRMPAFQGELIRGEHPVC